MLFTLEALQANEGDCLLLHFGTNDKPKLIVIDGGPGSIYEDSLRPRLLEIRENLSLGDKPLPLSMVMVSHMDDDHVTGIHSMMVEADTLKAENGDQLYKIRHMWVNTFDDIVGNTQIPKIASISSTASAAGVSAALGINIPEENHHIAAVIASTAKGRELRNLTNALGIPLNAQFANGNKHKLVVGGSDKSVIDDWDGLKITVLCPDLERLTKMQKKWDADLKKASDDGDERVIFASLGNTDTSPFNLSSIVCMVEFGEKRVLLTGDARSDDIYTALEEGGFLDDDGKMHVDILKMPHHGSARNMSGEFMENITATHYLISANGRDDNPDQDTLDKFSEMYKNKSGATVYFTNHEGKKDISEKMDAFIAQLEEDNSKLKIKFREPEGTILVNLLDELDF